VLILGSTDAGSVGLSAISGGKAAFGAGISADRRKQKAYGDVMLQSFLIRLLIDLLIFR
jgi:hypothetical protein